MIEPFNLAWWILIVLQFGLPVVLARTVFKDKTKEQKLNCIKWFTVFSAIVWVAYKYGLSKDPAFDFVFWDELPLQPCNTMLWLAIVACIIDNEFIMDYGFYIGIPCAMMALLMPEIEFIGAPIFSIRALGFYGTHAFVIMIGMSFVLFGLTEVSYRNALKSVLFFIFMACCAHIVNTVLRMTVHPGATYYYTYGFDENFLLKAIKGFIPVPLLYMAPIFVICYGFTTLETLIIKLCCKLGKKKTA